MKKKYYSLIGIIILVLLIVILCICCVGNNSYNKNKFVASTAIEQFDYNNYELPQIIWVYWDNKDTIPLCIQNIIKNNSTTVKTWKINFLTNDTLSDYIPNEDMPSFKKLVVAQKADWIRLYLLEKYGGCWCDAGIIINDENALTELRSESISKQSLFTGFYFESRVVDNNIFSYIENWFIMAPKNSTLIKIWRKEFEKAINMGFVAYRKQITNKNKQLSFDQLYHPKNKRDTYLTMHACFYNLSEDFDNNIISHILLYKAEDSMFKLQDECEWDRKCIHYKLDNDSNVKNIPFIKLVTDDRNWFDLSKYEYL